MIAVVLAGALAVGSAHHPVSTSSARAQALFDAGLTMLYSYNQEAARSDFQAARVADPHLAIAAWGEALADGSDLNTELNTVRFDRAQAAALQAVSLERYASSQERALIDAVAQRYAGTWAERAGDERRYRSSMAAVVSAYPNDDDAAMLYVEALLEAHTISDLWKTDGTPASADTTTIVRLIRMVLSRDPQHLMANHLCIHAYDYAADRTPARACADRLESMQLPPQAEHLAHIPAHTYMEIGEYGKAIASSERAYGMEHTKYAAHDAYVGWNAAMMLGDGGLAQKWAARFGTETATSVRLTTLARFGDWQAILAAASQRDLYKPFALGLAYAHAGNLPAARAQAALISKAAAATDFRELLAAEIAERQGDAAQSAAALRRAGEYQGNADGAETVPLFPAGESLGALYYRAANFQKARETFAAVLSAYPNDPRALYGMALSLQRLGDSSGASRALKRFDALWAAAPPRVEDL